MSDRPPPSNIVMDAPAVPQPTYAPAATAMACAMLTWGLLTHWSLSLAGGCLLAWGLGRWCSDILSEWRRST